MHNKILHYASMFIILAGGLFLIYLAFLWAGRNNALMSIGMLIMGLIALSNFYLHLRSMHKK